MAVTGYQNFDLLITRAPVGDGYLAAVIQSPAGETTRSHPFRLPFVPETLMPTLALDPTNTHDGFEPITFGTQLYRTIFAEQVYSCFSRSIDVADQKHEGLRLRFRLHEVPELAEVPWEYLYDPDADRFLALSEATSIVRYLHLPRPAPPLQVALPLHILAIVADPSDAAMRLDVQNEWLRLEQALAELQKQQRVVLTRLEQATLAQLQSRLRQPLPVHVIHFIGHGFFDEDQQQSLLLFEDENGRGQAVSPEILSVLLHDHRTLRLLFLNSCEGARATRRDTFGGMAQRLVQQGMAAIIAMQFSVTDHAALTLAEEFYRALADGYLVDAALAEARKALFITGNQVEWGTPVLFMHTPDGRLFSLEAGQTQATQPATPAPTVNIKIAADGGAITNSQISIGNIAAGNITKAA